MNIIKRALSTVLNSTLSFLTLGILPFVLWVFNKPLVGQMLLDTPQASTQIGKLMYGLFFVLLCISVIGIILIILWCVLGNEPLALQITKGLGFN